MQCPYLKTLKKWWTEVRSDQKQVLFNNAFTMQKKSERCSILPRWLSWWTKKGHFLVKVSEMETLGLGFLPSHPGEPQESRALCWGPQERLQALPFGLGAEFQGYLLLKKEDHQKLRHFPESVHEIDNHICFVTALHFWGIIIHERALGGRLKIKKTTTFFQISLKIRGI